MNFYIEPPTNLPQLESVFNHCFNEIERRDIEMGNEFASGQFGVVYRAIISQVGGAKLKVLVNEVGSGFNLHTWGHVVVRHGSNNGIHSVDLLEKDDDTSKYGSQRNGN